MRNFRQYDFWIDSKDLAVEITKLTKEFPVDERFALSSQLRRAIVSVPSNIAEGAGRESEMDFAHFLDIAIGSAYETETQVEIATDLSYITRDQGKNIIQRLQSVERRLAAFINKIRKQKV